MNFYWALRLLPKNHISYLIGAILRIRLPRPLSTWTVKVFAALYKIDMESAAEDISTYRCIGDLFVRNLKPGLRPIADGFVSPIDGTLRNWYPIESDQIPQVKGKSYSLTEFLKSTERAALFRAGSIFHFYLAPPDYHHIHAPISGSIAESVYIPGNLWPVNSWALSNIKDLFSKNERVVVYFDTIIGAVAVVLVGATNVGKISLEFDQSVAERYPSLRYPKEPISRRYTPPVTLCSGDRIGTFHMGSSVVVLTQQRLLPSVPANQHEIPVKYGQFLAKICA